ncbi:MAG: DUF2285 domain-containing protein [Mesorhizobium sp.]
MPKLFPATVIVTIPPEGFAAGPLIDPERLAVVAERTDDGLHALVADDGGEHSLWIPYRGLLLGTAILIPRDRYFLWRVRSAVRLHLKLDGKPSRGWPREQRLTPFQLHRASLMLRAWDGVESGAPRRHVAGVILNEDVEAMRAIDWHNAPERRRLSRLLKAARETIEGGYLRWLAPRKGR